MPTIAASYGGDFNFNGSTSSGISVQVVNFTLSVSPALQTISSGHMATYTLSVSAVNGFTGTISLGCSGGPPHSTCAVSPASVSLSGSNATSNATVSLSTPKNANHGTFMVTFTATYGSATRTATASLTVK